MQSNPPGFVPNFGHGIHAKEDQEGVVGGKRWLKSEKLHKYWPIFSNWSYNEIISLTEENIDRMVLELGASQITLGAKRKLLRCIVVLNQREEVLRNLLKALESGEMSLLDALEYLENVIHTPLPTDHSNILPSAIIYALSEVDGYILKNQCPHWAKQKFQRTLKEANEIPILRFATEMLYKCTLLEEQCNLPERCKIKSEKEKIKDAKPARQRLLTNDSGYEDIDWYSATCDSENIWPVEENYVMFTAWPKCLITETETTNSPPSPSFNQSTSPLNMSRLDAGSSMNRKNSMPLKLDSKEATSSRIFDNVGTIPKSEIDHTPFRNGSGIEKCAHKTNSKNISYDEITSLSHQNQLSDDNKRSNRISFYENINSRMKVLNITKEVPKYTFKQESNSVSPPIQKNPTMNSPSKTKVGTTKAFKGLFSRNSYFLDGIQMHNTYFCECMECRLSTRNDNILRATKRDICSPANKNLFNAPPPFSPHFSNWSMQRSHSPTNEDQFKRNQLKKERLQLSNDLRKSIRPHNTQLPSAVNKKVTYSNAQKSEAIILEELEALCQRVFEFVFAKSY